MLHPPASLRAAMPTIEEGRLFAYYLDQAADGFFRLMLGRRSVEILAAAYTQPEHDLSYQYVTFAEQDNRIVGMTSGYTGEQHRHSSERHLQHAAGWSQYRMMAISLLFSSMLRFIDTVPDGEFYLQAIAIEPTSRGKGIGSILMDSAEAFARSCGSERLALDVYNRNEGARKLYERRGMRVTSQWPNRWPIGSFRILRMVKDL